MEISKKICNGNNTYYALYTAFNGISLERSEKLFLIDMVEEYIRENDNRENIAQREAFFREAQLFRDRKSPRLIKQSLKTIWGLKKQLCKRIIHKKFDNTVNAAEQGNAEERPNAGCKIYCEEQRQMSLFFSPVSLR